ncbi:cuticle protein 16.8-like [Limulus polyphemus]|uniref:Cuticle protein 16.8-like n=1 Tax=Limulus polyphemus TaxID=6850 RepID=A0ABM1BCT1_LIMPO|nr:cuticle protein 16.8-like [Limulus polyphemus]
MFKIVVLCLAAAYVSAQYAPQYGYAPQPHKAVKVVAAPAYRPPVYGQHPYQNDPYAKPQPYNFGYEIRNDYGDRQWQQEQGDEYGNKQGSFGYTDAYGISRQVEYVADEGGFRANVKTNEPGTANQNPADVNVYSDAPPVKYDVPPKGYAPHNLGYAAPAPKIVKTVRPVAYAAAAPAYGYAHPVAYPYARPAVYVKPVRAYQPY